MGTDHAATQHHRRPHGVHLDSTTDRYGDAPSILNAPYTFKAEIEVLDSNAEGMLITQGGRFGGYGFYLLKGKPVFRWNLVDLKHISLGRSGSARSRKAHPRIRLQL